MLCLTVAHVARETGPFSRILSDGPSLYDGMAQCAVDNWTLSSERSHI